MVGLFNSRENIKDLPIYPTRGNHDCYFDDMQAEPKLKSKYPTWQMDGLWYEKQFKVGKNGEKMSLMMVDSCLLICASLINKKDKKLLNLDEETREVFL
jgi:hypothetical protein